MFKSRNVAVLGLGYVGSVTAACLADIGHNVIGNDCDEQKVQNILDGHAPFYEPGLEELVATHRQTGRLTATTSLADALSQADVALIAVGTPSEKNGNINLEQLRRVVENIASLLTGRSRPLIVAIRSTVFPGTCENVVAPLLASYTTVTVVSNPEFLREGTAVLDFKEPSLLVVGGTDPDSVRTVADLYAPLGIEPCLVELRAAEMIKYACNAFHAVKICFANEMGTVCTSLGIDAHEVMRTLCNDVRLNISPAYLKPGFAFGGSCLPKDLRALTYRATRLDLRLPLLESALSSNQEHLHRAIRDVLALPAERLGIMGLAFKENTDDLRESSVVTLLEYLIGKGRQLRIYDPHIQMDSIYGTNRNFILNAIPYIGRLLEQQVEDVLTWAQWVVVTQKLPDAILKKLATSQRPVLDLTGTFARFVSPTPAVNALANNQV